MDFSCIISLIFFSPLCWGGWLDGVALLLGLLEPSTSDASPKPDTLSLDN